MPKLRMKPRLAADTPVSPSPPPVDAAASPPPLPPTEPPTGFRLKPKAAAFEAESSNAPPPFTEGAALAPTVVPRTGRSPEELAAQGKKVQFAALTIGALGLLLFAGVGYRAYSGQWNATEEFASEESMELLDGDDDTPAAASRPDLVAPPAPVPPATVTSADAAPPVLGAAPGSRSDASAPADVAPTPSLEFRTYVANLRILGVRAGANPRVLIDRTSYNLGATINQELGIIFAGYDSERHLVRFKDASGAIVDRPDR